MITRVIKFDNVISKREDIKKLSQGEKDKTYVTLEQTPRAENKNNAIKKDE